LGEARFEIDKEALKVFKESQFTPKNIQMYIDPYQERESPTSAWYGAEVPAESLQFNWTISYFQLPYIFVQLDFNEASAISPLAHHDYLVINVTNTDELFDLTSLPISERQSTCYLNTTIGK
jgi:hypothetical protein